MASEMAERPPPPKESPRQMVRAEFSLMAMHHDNRRERETQRDRQVEED